MLMYGIDQHNKFGGPAYQLEMFLDELGIRMEAERRELEVAAETVSKSDEVTPQRKPTRRM